MGKPTDTDIAVKIAASVVAVMIEQLGFVEGMAALRRVEGILNRLVNTNHKSFEDMGQDGWYEYIKHGAN